MKTGIVFEIANGKATILINGGEFVTINAKKDWKKGDIVPVKRETFKLKPLYSLVACLVFLFGIGSYGFNVYFTETSVLSMDINPSMEFGLNCFDYVVSVTPKNPEAKKILSNVNVKNKKYDDALNLIIAKEDMEKYLNSNDVTFSVYSNSEDKEKVLMEGLKVTATTSILQHHANIDVEYYSVNNEVIENAHNHGVTAGKYVYLQQLKDLEPEINIDNYTHHSIEEIKNHIEECHKGYGFDPITQEDHHKFHHK